jgi:hypothetical protein
LERFGKARLKHGALEWPNGADICPDLLYYGGPAPWARQFIESRRNRPPDRSSTGNENARQW